jgi:membrane protease YdiL (CAAX protease family)
LITGSIWVPVILHFAIDVTNMLVFNIVGRFSFFEISPKIKAQPMASFRVVTAVVLISVLVALFGTTIRLA